MNEAQFAGPAQDPDRFHLLDDGTRGGEGRTWRAAYRGGLNSPLPQAVKMLFPPSGRPGPWPGEADIRRWEDSAALLRHLDQPHVVKLHDIFAGEPPHAEGTAGGAVPTVAYLQMEWVEGPTLAESVRGSAVSRTTLRDRLRWITEIATAVDSLHSTTRSAGNPALHRDLTPGNCIVHAQRGIVVIDISGMRLVDDGFDPLGRHTPAYTAPEVLARPHVPRQPSSDLYAVGAVALFCMTGEDAAAPETLAPLLRRAGAGQPAEAAAHLLRMTAADPDERPTDVAAWARRLAELAAPRRRWVLPAAAAAVTALLAAGTGVVLKVAADEPPAVAATRRPAALAGFIEPRPGGAGVAAQDFSSTRGTIDGPLDTARDCEYYHGTARLPPGHTLVLSLHTRGEAPANMRWIQVIFQYPRPPSGEWKWRAAQYFNDGMLGKDTVVELIELPDIAQLKSAEDASSFIRKSELAWYDGTVLATRTVTHVNAHNPRFPCAEFPEGA